MDKDTTHGKLEKKILELEAELVQTKSDLKISNRERMESLSILTNLPLHTLIVDRDRRIRQVNKSLLSVLGADKSKILDLRIGEVFQCLDFKKSAEGRGFDLNCERCKLRELIEDTFTFGTFHRQVETGLHILGNAREECIYLVSTGIILFENEPHVIVYLEDVSIKRQSESSLKESREHFRLLFYHAPVMIHSIDSQGILLEVNKRWQEKMGYSRDEAIGCPSVDFMSPDTRKYVETTLRKEVFRTGKARKEPIQLITKSGNIVETLCSARCGYEESGEIAYSIAVFDDITRQLEVERALRHSEERYKLLFNQSPIGIVYTNARGVVIDANERCSQMMGTTREKLIGSNGFEITHNPLFLEGIISASKGEIGHYRGEYQSEFSNKKLFINATVQGVRDANGAIFGGIAIFEDISQTHQHEELMRLQRDLGIKLGMTEDLTEALSISLDTALLAGGCDCGGIYLVDQHSGDVSLAVHKGLPTDFVDVTSLYSADSPQARVIARGDAVFMTYQSLLENIDLDQQEQDVRGTAGLRSTAIVPVRYEGRVIAALNVASKIKDDISDFSQYSLEAIAVQISGALVKAEMNHALKSSQKNLQTLFEDIEDFLFVLDSSGGIVEYNPVVVKRLGYNAEELTDMKVLDVHPPERREEAGAIVAEMLAGKRSFCPIPLMKKDGTLIPVETRIKLGMWNNQEAIFGISRDISERLEMEKARQLSEDRLLAAIEAIDEGFALFDSDDRLAMCNAKYMELYKTSTDLFVTGTRFEDIITEGVKRGQYPEASGREEEWIAERMAEHRMATRSVEQKLDDGRWLKISERRMKDGSNVGFRVDITDIKKSEERFRLALREKETLLREIHHRVKNNMQVVTSLLSLQAAKYDDPKLLQIFSEAEGRVRSMSLVHEILYRSDKFSEVNAQDYLAQLAAQLFGVFHSRSIRLKLQIEAEGVSWGIDHAVPCGLVVAELLTNAFKYGFPENKTGEIRIIATHPDSHHTRVVIEDDGVGLPDDFEARSRKNLGLRLVKSLVEDQLEGTWTIDSNKGTRCTLEWPCLD